MWCWWITACPMGPASTPDGEAKVGDLVERMQKAIRDADVQSLCISRPFSFVKKSVDMADLFRNWNMTYQECRDWKL
jgi:hypothetical protein